MGTHNPKTKALDLSQPRGPDRGYGYGMHQGEFYPIMSASGKASAQDEQSWAPRLGDWNQIGGKWKAMYKDYFTPLSPIYDQMGELFGQLTKLSKEAKKGYQGQTYPGLVAPTDPGVQQAADIAKAFIGGPVMQKTLAGEPAWELTPEVLENYIRTNIARPARQTFEDETKKQLQDTFSGTYYGSERQNATTKAKKESEEFIQAEADKARLEMDLAYKEEQANARNRALTLGPQALENSLRIVDTPRQIAQLGLDKQHAAWAERFPMTAQILGEALNVLSEQADVMQQMFANNMSVWQTQVNQEAAQDAKKYGLISSGVDLLGNLAMMFAGMPATGGNVTGTTGQLGRTETGQLAQVFGSQPMVDISGTTNAPTAEIIGNTSKMQLVQPGTGNISRNRLQQLFD